MISIAKMSKPELAAFVQEKLRTKGINTVLSGGACVSIYSKGKYVSMDLDMIHESFLAPKRRIICEAMKELGFTEEGRYFIHADTDIFVEFPKGPLSVGEEPVKEICNRYETTGLLRIISPTDCIKDRLTWFYHDKDQQCLEQAVLVARENQINLDEIERWSANEGKSLLFQQIRKRLNTNK
jgi:hypothetical protein